MMSRMKALRKAEKGPGLSLEKMLIPCPDDGEVLVRVKAASICGSDLHIYGWDRWSAGRMKPPVMPGHEFCGVVERTDREERARAESTTIHVRLDGAQRTERKQSRGFLSYLRKRLVRHTYCIDGDSVFAAMGERSQIAVFRTNRLVCLRNLEITISWRPIASCLQTFRRKESSRRSNSNPSSRLESVPYFDHSSNSLRYFSGFFS